MDNETSISVQQALADAAHEMRCEVELIEAHAMPGDVLIVEYSYANELPHDPDRKMQTTRLGVWVRGQRAYGVLIGTETITAG